MTHFLLADDQAIVRLGLRNLINDNFESAHIDEAGTQNEVMQLAKSRFYNIVIFDVNMGGTNFLQIMRWFKIVSPHTRIVIFTTQSEDILGKTCLQLGAWGFVPKKAPTSELVSVLRRLLEGKKYISPTLAMSLVQSGLDKEQSNPFQSLSARELEVVLLLNEGKTLVEICNLLHIEYSTVNTHKRKIFEKLMIGNVLSLSRLMQTFHTREAQVVEA